MKIIYHNFETKEDIEDELPEHFTWLDKQFYRKYVLLEEDEINFCGESEWRLTRYIPVNVLEFEFNSDEYTY